MMANLYAASARYHFDVFDFLTVQRSGEINERIRIKTCSRRFPSQASRSLKVQIQPTSFSVAPIPSVQIDQRQQLSVF